MNKSTKALLSAIIAIAIAAAVYFIFLKKDEQMEEQPVAEAPAPAPAPAAPAPVPAPAPATPAAEVVINAGNGAEPETIDPHRSTGVPENVIENDLFEGLVTYSADGQLIPGMAEGWEISDDGLTYTFKLRDSKWSNGDDVTAEDFVYSFQRAVNPATASDYAPILGPIVNASEIIDGTVADLAQLGVTAPDNDTVVIQLENPAPYLLGLLAHNIAFPVHKGNVEQFGDDFTKAGNLVSNGPFMLADWVPQSHLAVVKNPHYYDAAAVMVDKVVYYPTEDTAEELKRYQAGELDVTSTLPSDQIPWLKENMADEMHITPYFGTYYYGVNLTRAPIGTDINLRKALSMAIDRDIIVEKITQAGQVPAYSWVPPGIPGYEQQKVDFADMPMADRLAMAAELLAGAGYGPDNPLKVELLYNTSENHKKIAVAIAAMWAPLGVEVTLTNQEWGTYLETRDQKAYEVTRAAWIGDYLDATNFLDLFISSAGERNDLGFNNAEFDALIEQSGTENDPAKRQAILAQAERIFLDNHPMMPIYHYVNQYMLNPKISGYEPNLMGVHRMRWVSVNG